MALTKRIEVQRIEAQEDAEAMLFEDEIIEEDGIELTRRRIGRPIDLDEDLSLLPPLARDVASAVYTPARVAIIRAAKQRRANETGPNPPATLPDVVG